MADSDTIPEIRKRGRPPTAEPAQIANVALRLFERRGFDVVTMDEIADASEVSARTLFRLFPTKSDLVWHGLHEMRDAVSAQAESLRGSGLSPAELLRTIAEPFLSPMERPAVARLARRRLRLIAEAPALLNHPTLRELEAIVASLVDQKNGPPALLARTVIAVAFGAMFWWAEDGAGVTPLEALNKAFQGIGRRDPAASGRGSRARANRSASDRSPFRRR